MQCDDRLEHSVHLFQFRRPAGFAEAQPYSLELIGAVQDLRSRDWRAGGGDVEELLDAVCMGWSDSETEL